MKKPLKFTGFAVCSFALLACNEHDLPTDYPEQASSSSVISSSSSFDPFGTMVDSAGNIYKTIKLTGQEWATENLRYTVAGDSSIACRDSVNGKCSHALYNYKRAKNVCPSAEGWRLPTDADWRKLVNLAGSKYASDCANQSVPAEALTADSYKRFPLDVQMGTCIGSAGKALKSQSGWASAARGDDLLFLAILPDGYRDISKEYLQKETYAYFWSSDSVATPIYPEDSVSGSSWYFTKSNSVVHQVNYKDAWLSVRCMRDLP